MKKILTIANDLEGAVERLKRLAYELDQSCGGFPEAYAAARAMYDAADALARITRERDGYQKHLRACEQVAGKALGYPWFRDDQTNFPGTTEAEGVCIGDHVGDTIVEELATRFEAVTRERDAMREAHRPYAALSVKAKGRDDDCWCGQDGAVIRYRDLRLSAALVNKEGE